MKFGMIAILAIVIGFFYLVYKGVEISAQEDRDCRAKGGYALMERGVFQDCLKGIEVIK